MYDAVIVGAGGAGLSAALGFYRSQEVADLRDRGIEPKVLVISKLQPLRSHTGSAATWNPTNGNGITTTP